MRRLLLVPFTALALSLTLALSLASPASAEAWVERLQTRLNQLGCNAGPVDGRMGDMTRAGLIRFQAANRLSQTGRIDDRTRQALYQWKVPAKCNRRAVPKYSGTGRRIVISQRQNWIWLVRSDGTVARQGGMIDNPAELSPGTFFVGDKCGRTAKIRLNTSGSLWLDYFTRFAPCGIGFHQIPRYQSNGQQIHPDWLLGTDYRTSHGCIRLSRSVVQSVWDWAQPGAKVVVVRG